MSPYLASLLLILIALVQTTLSPHLAILGAYPNLMLLVVLSWTLLRTGREGMLWAFGGGVLLDMLSGAPFGASTLPLLLVSFLSSLGEETLFRTTLSLPLAVGFAGSLLYDSVFLATLQLMGWQVDWPTSLWRLILPAAGLNTLLMPLVYALLRQLHQHIKGVELSW
ncbi:MAG: rod shape-determining protein MreD [Chloroflexota bacterium]|nr:rod shape-determining protein MreD [Chloroflexota bacterium]